MPLAERLQRPVHDEARAVGRDLEQDAVRLPEVEADRACDQALRIIIPAKLTLTRNLHVPSIVTD
jgi:hypothetical protein